MNKVIQTPKTLYVNSENMAEKIKLINIEDSRCPKGVKCFTEGRAKITLQLIENGNTRTIDVFSDQKGFIHLFKKNYHISTLTPYPKKGVSVSLKDYTLHLKLHTDSIK